MLVMFICTLLTLSGPSAAATDATAVALRQSAPSIPDTPAGRALKEFVESLNAGGEKRRAWLYERTTIEKDQADEILKQDSEIIDQHGAVTVVRLPEASPHQIVAIIRHQKTGAHGHLTIDVQPTAPHKVSNMQLRGATPEEIKR